MNNPKPSFIGKNKGLPRRRLSYFWTSQLLVFFIGLIFLLIILVPLLKNYAKQRAVANEIKDIQQEIADFESKNKDLSAMFDYLESNESLEEQARLNLGLKKPGEKVVVVQSEAINDGGATTTTSTTRSNWSKWWRYFFQTQR